jgi:MFS family permease
VAQTGTQSEEASSLRLVWQRDFTLYFVGVVCSLTGYWVRFVAQGWLVYELTASPWQLGLVGFFTTLPVFLFSPLAGVAVDRFSRKGMLAVTQVGMLLVVVALALLDSLDLIQVWQIMAIAFIGGAISAFDWPTRLSLVPNLVEPALLPRAVALNSAAWSGARIGGPVVAGLLLPLVGTAGSFWVAAALFAPVMLALPFIRVRSGGERRAGENFLANLRGGYAYVLGNALLLSLLLMELVPIVFGQTFPNLMPVFVAEVLRQEASALGWLMAALGAGELIGTLTIALTSLVPRRPISVLIGVAIFGAMMLLFALSTSLPMAMACLALAGIAAAGYSTLNGTLIQEAVEDRYRGRVMSVYSMIWGLTPIGALELGAVAQGFGAPAAVFVNGLILLLFVLALAIRAPYLRKL